MANIKPLVRFLYAYVPGLAASRFTAMDLTASIFAKSEYRGCSLLHIDDGLIIDIGANRGQSIAAFRRNAPRSRIIAFEPEPRSAKRLISRFRTVDSIKIIDRALGNQSSSITLFIPSYGRWRCDGMAATDRKTAVDWLKDSGRMYRFNPKKLSVTKHIVQCDKLDTYNLLPKLIKIHAQGAELDILRSSTQTLKCHRPALMCAFASEQISEFLAPFGYRPYISSRQGFRAGLNAPPLTFTWYLTDLHLDSDPDIPPNSPRTG